MIVLLLLIPLSILIAVAFLAAFIWAIKSGQYEDTSTPSLRALMEEPSHTHPKQPGAENKEDSKIGQKITKAV